MCTFLAYSWVTTARQRLQALGSTQIENLCYQDQWAMVAIKGQGVALSEARSAAAGPSDASTQAKIVEPWTDDPLIAASTIVKAIHLTAQAYAAAGVSPPTYSDPALSAGLALQLAPTFNCAPVEPGTIVAFATPTVGDHP